MKWQGGGITKGHKENLRGDGYVHYLDCGDGVYRCVYVKTYQIVYFKHVVYCMSIIPQ